MIYAKKRKTHGAFPGQKVKGKKKTKKRATADEPIHEKLDVVFVQTLFVRDVPCKVVEAIEAGALKEAGINLRGAAIRWALVRFANELNPMDTP